MPFMGRGDFSSIKSAGNQANNIRRYGYYRRFYYYIPLDNTYVIMQMIITFIILIVGTITFFVVYKSPIIDPIESTKGLFINTYLITIGTLVGLNLLVNFMSKSQIALIKRLVIILIISIILMLIFFGIKLNLDKTYTKGRFEQFYEEQNINESSNNATKSRINIGLDGLNIKTEKDYYIDECLKLYNIFSTKTYGTIRTSFFA